MERPSHRPPAKSSRKLLSIGRKNGRCPLMLTSVKPFTLNPKIATTHISWMGNQWRRCRRKRILESPLALICESLYKAYNIAHTSFRFIARNFEYITPDVMLSFYNSLVRPYLEYAVQIWSTIYRKIIDLLERIQHNTTKIISTLRVQPQEERLKRSFTQEKRRLRGNMIQVLKYLKMFNNAHYSKLYKLQTNSRTRNNGLPIQTSRCNIDIGRSFFSNQVICHFNSLPTEVVNDHQVLQISNLI